MALTGHLFMWKITTSFFDSFGGQRDKLLLEQLPNPITFLNYKYQDITCNLCGTYCFYKFDLTERFDYYNAGLKTSFGLSKTDDCFWQHISNYGT